MFLNAPVAVLRVVSVVMDQNSVLPQSPARNLSLTASMALGQWFMAKVGAWAGRGAGSQCSEYKKHLLH